MIKFSILVCTLTSRKHLLQRLMDRLNPQLTEEVEVVVCEDEKQDTVGTKRNKLLNDAKGEYIAFVDDDDLVSTDYVSKVLKAIESNPDCCGIEGSFTVNKTKPKKLVHSLSCSKWYEKDNVCYRTPNHLNPVKREIALKVGFNDLNAGEDRDYSFRLKEHLASESYIDGIIYIYDYQTEGSATNIRPNQFAYRNTFGGDFKMSTVMHLGSGRGTGCSIAINNLVYVLDGKDGKQHLEGSVANKDVKILYDKELPNPSYVVGKKSNVEIERKGPRVVVRIGNKPILTYIESGKLVSILFRKQRSKMHVEDPKIVINGKEVL